MPAGGMGKLVLRRCRGERAETVSLGWAGDGGRQARPKRDECALVQVCDIPDNELVFSGIALGYADESSEINTLRSERGDMGEWVSEGHDETRPRYL